MLLIEDQNRNRIAISKNYNKTLLGYQADGYDYQSKVGFNFFEIEESAVVKLIAQEKFNQLNVASQEALKSFKYQGLTFEYSGSSKSDLIATMQFIQQNPSHTQVWFALDGTYNIGDPDNIVVNAASIEEFSNAFFNHAGTVFAWKETQKYYLEKATTLEEVEAISTVYNG